VSRRRRRWPFAAAALVALFVPVLVSATGTAASVAHTTRAPLWPKPIKPLFKQPLRGEGKWRGTGPKYHGGPPVLRTFFRTSRANPSVIAYVAWFDRKRTSVAFYPGRSEPPHAAVRGPAMVPTGQRHRLLATFNSGFTYAYNGNGSSINGRENEPLKKGLGTLVQYKSGTIAIVNWHGGVNTSKRVAWARQSLPPIVWNGKPNPKLNDSKEWGEAFPGPSIYVWRTGVGIDRRGNLIFVVADSQSVETLARVLIHAGAVRGMQFDINAYWHTLITYTHKGGLHPTMVEPQANHSAYRYLTPDDRDFFAVYRRRPGAFTVPFK